MTATTARSEELLRAAVTSAFMSRHRRSPAGPELEHVQALAQFLRNDLRAATVRAGARQTARALAARLGLIEGRTEEPPSRLWGHLPTSAGVLDPLVLEGLGPLDHKELTEALAREFEAELLMTVLEGIHRKAKGEPAHGPSR